MANIRLLRIKNFLDKSLFTHILLSDTIDIEYLTDFQSSNVYCIISKQKNVLCSDFRYREAALAFCRRHRGWKFLEVKENDFLSFSAAFGVKGIVGFQSHVVTVDQFRMLRARCPGVRFAHLPKDFQDIFAPKLPDEILFMQKAAAIGDKAFGVMLRRARPGITEQELAGVCDNECRKRGSERPSFDTIVLFGRRAALPHGRPSNARLRNGDWVLCDFGCTVQGFASDMTRTFVMGKASVRQKKLYDVVCRAQESARRFAAAGVKACDVDSRARQVIAMAGHARLFGHATGHGVGLRVHEKPRIGANDGTILQKGTVITIEPGIYDGRWGGIRIEDMVVVGENGCEVLTKSPRHLIEAGIR